MRLWVVISAILSLPVATVAGDGSLRLERLDIGASAELLTIFSNQTGSPEPVISILRDTLGDDDPSNDKIRDIWVLAYARPSIGQRLAASLPFFYRKSGAKPPGKGKPPATVLDYSATARRGWSGLLGKLLQTKLMDANGLWTRATTRSYRGNAGEYRNMRISQALHAIGPLELPREPFELSSDEIKRIQGRLILTQRLFGDLVSVSYLATANERYETRASMMRAHNWELLRQKAEENGLYFQPLGLGSEEVCYALLWVAREDLAGPPTRAFDKRFLHIASPWNDARLAPWKAPTEEAGAGRTKELQAGYSETWHFDIQSRRVDAGVPGSRAVEVIPLALYTLDHPKTPLLLIDFRNLGKVRRSEMGRRAISDTATDVLGITGFGNWTYLGARRAWDFLRGRWGAPVNRQARLKAYASLRHALAQDTSLDPRLRGVITECAERLSVNPFEWGLEEEATLARQQHQALVAWAKSPEGLSQRLDRDRRLEMVALAHGKPARALFGSVRALSLGFYRHREEPAPGLMAQLDRHRRIAYYTAQFEQMLDSSPRPEVATGVRDIGNSLEGLTRLIEQDASRGKRIARMVSRLFRQTSDDTLRRQCLESLARIRHPEAAKELARLLADPTVYTGLHAGQESSAKVALAEARTSVGQGGSSP